MSVYIQKSDSGAYFIVQDGDAPPQPYAVNDLRFINIDNESFSLVDRYNPNRFIIEQVNYADVINGETGDPFESFLDTQAYILTNFYR